MSCCFFGNAVEQIILIACDAVMKDDLRKTSIKMVKPSGVKLLSKVWMMQ